MKACVLRKTIQDKNGVLYELDSGGSSDIGALVDMYDIFLPKSSAQGLPPSDAPARRDWVCCIMDKGENFLIRKDGQVVGHAALLPDFSRKDAEYMIFVEQDFRDRGLGSALTRAAVEHARALGLEVIWLSVDGHNYPAIGLYKKFGFCFCDDGGWERLMVLRLV